MYLCRIVGSQFSPCANRSFTAPGQFPMNVFQVNPFGVNGLQVVDDDGWSNYHAMQLQFRRRYATGVSMNVNYTYGKNNGNVWADNATQSANYITLRDRAMNDGPAPFDVRHVFQAFGTYDLPWGRGRRYEIENGLIDGLARRLDVRQYLHGAVRNAVPADQRTPDGQRQRRRRGPRERPHCRGDPEDDQHPSAPDAELLAVLGGRGAGRTGRTRQPRVPHRADDAR